VPSIERRDALIEAAMREFARDGLHGTPVSRIAERVGVAQPYVFSLFPTKKRLFLAAIDRCFNTSIAIFREAATSFDPATAPPGTDIVSAMGAAYVDLLAADRDVPLFQHQAYAASADDEIRTRVRARFADLLHELQELSGASADRVDELVRQGMALNVAAAIGVDGLSVASDWVRTEFGTGRADDPRRC
jgi:AcrR family transcriptional regulator